MPRSTSNSIGANANANHTMSTHPQQSPARHRLPCGPIGHARPVEVDVSPHTRVASGQTGQSEPGGQAAGDQGRDTLGSAGGRTTFCRCRRASAAIVGSHAQSSASSTASRIHRSRTTNTRRSAIDTRSSDPLPPTGGGHRLPWRAVPVDVRRAIERIAGGRVVRATSQPSGFSPGLAARLELGDGRRVFAKALSDDRSAVNAGFHRREAYVAGSLPPDLPAPRLLGSHDDGGWVALVFEDVDGRQPAQPWHPDELDKVLDTLTTLAEHATPSPVELEPVAALPRLGGWTTVAADRHLRRRLVEVAPEAVRHVDMLSALESDWPAAVAGRSLVHGDVYPHNILLTPDRVVLVDWPHAHVGRAYLDLLTALSSAALSGLDPEPYLARHPLAHGVDPAVIDTVLAAHTGFLLLGALDEPEPMLRGIPVVKRALGRAALGWLLRRLAAP